MQSVFKNFIITFCVSLIIFSVIAFFIVGVVRDKLIPENPYPDDPIEDNAEDEINSGTTPSSKPKDEINASKFTVLLIGDDYQPDILDDYESDGITVNGFAVHPRKIMTDTLILVNIDGTTKTASFCPLPNNLRISYKGGYIGLGELYGDEGIEYLLEAVTGVTGVSVDYYVHTSMNSLASMIDELGGVNYTVPVDMYYKDESQELEINLTKGQQTLDGGSAVNLLRYTSYNNGNSQRMVIGVDFLRALVSKLIGYNTLDALTTLYTSLSKYVDTDFSVDDAAKHFSTLIVYPEFSVNDMTYPASAVSYGGYDYLEPQISEAVSLFGRWK